jgi:two-component system, LytTR family, sensor kinase
LSFVSIGISMLCGGLAGGLLNRQDPERAVRPSTGFCLTFLISAFRTCLIYGLDSKSRALLPGFAQLVTAPVLQGFGSAVILTVIAYVRKHDDETKANVSAELRALEARMNPHFLFNALNALAALAMIAPREVPRAAGKLRNFLRASFDQHERHLVPLREELAVVRAYLDIELLRLGNRLKIEETIEAGLLELPTPSFSLQLLVENAVRHGLQSSAKAGHLHVKVHTVGDSVEMTVSDDGQGVPSNEIEQIFFPERPALRALSLLRRRLHTLFGRSSCVKVRSEIGQGTTVTMSIPLRPPTKLSGESLTSSETSPVRPSRIRLLVTSLRYWLHAGNNLAPRSRFGGGETGETLFDWPPLTRAPANRAEQ